MSFSHKMKKNVILIKNESYTIRKKMDSIEQYFCPKSIQNDTNL